VANEINAIATLREIANSQSIFKRTDWDDDGLLEYAFPYHKLYVIGTQRPDLITINVAQAYVTGYGGADAYVPIQGYVLYDNRSYEVAGGRIEYVLKDDEDDDSDAPHRYGAHAWPAGYNLTGRNSFSIDDKGNIWQVDSDVPDPMIPEHNYHHIFLPPGMKNFGWVNPN